MSTINESPPPTYTKEAPQQTATEERHVQSDEESAVVKTQDGVKAMEAVSMTWSKWGLIVAYLGIFLMAFSTSLEAQTTFSYSAFATSSFQSHSLLSTVTVVQSVVLAVMKPIMSKVSDVTGRLEAFTLSIVLFVLGFIQQAASTSIDSYASAQIFYSAGSTGVQILQQIFIADTSNLLWRALFSSLPDIPFLVTVWVGPEISARMLEQGSWRWRWGYGMWAIILPVAFLPFAISLFLNQRKAKKLGVLDDRGDWISAIKRQGPATTFIKVVQSVDLFGILLLSAGFALLLIPLTIATRQTGGWGNGSIIAMLIIGAISLIAFCFWECASARINPHPLIPLYLFKSKTFCAGCGIAFFYFMVFYLSVFPYYNSYLLVVHRMDIATAGRITQVFSFSSTVMSVLVSLAIRYTKHYKYFITAGSLLYLLGIALMINYRSENAGMPALIGTQVCIGVGGGMLNVPTQLGVQATAKHQNLAIATAVWLTVLELGGAVGSAISGAIWTKVVPATLTELLPEASRANATMIFNNVNTAMALEWGSPERMAINAAYQAGMRQMLIVAVCMCVPIVLLSLLMRNMKLDEVDQGVKGYVIGGRVDGDSKKDAGTAVASSSGVAAGPQHHQQEQDQPVQEATKSDQVVDRSTATSPEIRG
ncbi:hypothetical protein MCOR02_005367 [Pyricularia oryzae]|uniref:Major facilitator superfamily (MFS) profile domain-containing protein n=2 Tax=Pyricularia TaxID=48558 RepID=A0ABQ8N5B3_PYRGI|nr:hypothetical protein MCOR01_008017 [Pyricularia oryzae]KAI6291530.1 hypothetical protein MCOR33_010552 [Pyricularia grisea]KAH9433314.1 hypothetical protein MCOR02_005367 [Pyricularia oryzae]KAI6252441.1 hypothetical protein MCOR19_010947 [Pyricularia oryzae]KAI6265039.1 hypothetical protein MCOR26_010966 [Pyricularia oryzae]